MIPSAIQAVIDGRSRWAMYRGDSSRLLSRLPANCVDHVITDPPFDARTTASLCSKKKNLTVRVKVPWAPFERYQDARRWAELARRWVIVFCNVEQLGRYADACPKEYVRGGFWFRPDSAPQFSGDRPAQPGEGVAILHRAGVSLKRWNGHGTRAFWNFPTERDPDRFHPTQKPIALMMEIVRQFTDPGDLVIDPFSGSATTGVACLRLGRRFIGAEKHQPFAAAAIRRLEAEARFLSVSDVDGGQMALLGS